MGVSMSLAEISLSEAPRHLKVTGHRPAFGYEPCEDVGCSVLGHGVASSCERIACPACGCGGTNLSELHIVDAATGRWLRCTCGHSWVQGARPAYVLTSAETAECTCPDDCECDHGND
jgi:hypothetical protein